VISTQVVLTIPQFLQVVLIVQSSINKLLIACTASLLQGYIGLGGEVLIK
jgi:hypothetical protein